MTIKKRKERGKGGEGAWEQVDGLPRFDAHTCSWKAAGRMAVAAGPILDYRSGCRKQTSGEGTQDRGVETEAEEGRVAHLRGRVVGKEQRVVCDREGERGVAEQGTRPIRGALPRKGTRGRDGGGNRSSTSGAPVWRGDWPSTPRRRRRSTGRSRRRSRRRGAGRSTREKAGQGTGASMTLRRLQVGGGRAEEGGRVLLRRVEGGGGAQGERAPFSHASSFSWWKEEGAPKEDAFSFEAWKRTTRQRRRTRSPSATQAPRRRRTRPPPSARQSKTMCRRRRTCPPPPARQRRMTRTPQRRRTPPPHSASQRGGHSEGGGRALLCLVKAFSLVTVPATSPQLV